MLKKNGAWLIAALGIYLYQSTAYSLTTYKLTPGQAMVLTNTLNRPISADCLINAVANVVNSVSINMLSGAGLFNGNSVTRGQTLFQNVYNTQYIPITASAGASARITNIGGYTLQAQCTLN